MLILSGRRSPRSVAVAAAIAVGAVIGASAPACLSVSPPLPTSSASRPVILHDAVVPTASAVLVDWPEDNTFIVPVEVESGDSFFYDVFVDYDADAGTPPTIAPQAEVATSESLNGGVFMVQFVLPPPDPRACHTIDVLVAHAFNASSPRTADSIGGDIVTWFYTAGDVNGCPGADAGLPPPDASDAETDAAMSLETADSP